VVALGLFFENYELFLACTLSTTLKKSFGADGGVDGVELSVVLGSAFAIGALGAVITFLLRRALPESPRWLESVGRATEADAVVQRFETAGGVHPDTLPVSVDAEPAATTPLPAGTLFRLPLVRRTC
jgi:putative MFS transporter